MRPGGQMRAKQDRLARRGHGADDIRARDSSLYIAGTVDHRNAEFCFHLCFIAPDAFRHDIPDANLADLTHKMNRLQMASCLQAGTQNAERMRILPRQRVSRGGTDGGGADAGDRVAVQQGLQHAGIRVKQQHNPLMGRQSALEVVREDCDRLYTHNSGSCIRRRHQPQQLSLADRQDAPQCLDGAARGIVDQYLPHEPDTAAHVQKSANHFFLIVMHVKTSRKEFYLMLSCMIIIVEKFRTVY